VYVGVGVVVGVDALLSYRIVSFRSWFVLFWLCVVVVVAKSAANASAATEKGEGREWTIPEEVYR
jgi:hypothetical protein